MKRKFLADAMLGSLARWLRVLGCDTHYQSRYKAGDLPVLLSDGRMLLSRNRKTVGMIPESVLILSERLREQIVQMKSCGLIPPPEEEWFTRCLVCNVSLENADSSESQEDVPEYVIHERPRGIRRCPSCGRTFWPGTHRERMMMQLREWGL
jgi:uncharacterized protein with PIN domain